MMPFMGPNMVLIFVTVAQEHSMVDRMIARSAIVGGVIQIGTHVNSRKLRREYNIMAKQAQNVRLVIAAELLKLEARLDEELRSRFNTSRDELAREAIKVARDHLLER